MFIISFPPVQKRASCWGEVTKFTFFIAASEVLCPALMAQTGLVTHVADNTSEQCWHSSDASCFTLHHLCITNVSRGWARSWEGAVRTTEPYWPKGYSMPFDIVLSSNNGKRWRKEGTFMVIALVFPTSHYMCWGPHSQKAGDRPADAK